MSNNLKDESELDMKKTLKLVKIPLNFKKMKIDNEINSNNNTESKNKKLRFNNIMKNEIKILKTESSSLEKTSESFITNKNLSNRDFDFLKEKFKNSINIFNIPFKRNVNLFTTEGKKTININNTFRIQPLNLNSKILFNNTKIINNNINDNNNDKLNEKSISNYFIKNPFKENSPLKLNETFKNKFFNKNESILNKHKKTYSTEKKNRNGYKDFLTRTTISNLPIVITKNTELKEEKSKKDINQTEKEKYEQLSETFIKIKCLLNLDCEPGNEREYIKNFFIKFGYNNNDITEDKISNFLNFINEEPFPIDPKKTLKENIILAMNYNKNESDNEYYDEEEDEEEKEKNE
jgi:hypothetical protein